MPFNLPRTVARAGALTPANPAHHQPAGTADLPASEIANQPAAQAPQQHNLQRIAADRRNRYALLKLGGWVLVSAGAVVAATRLTADLKMRDELLRNKNLTVEEFFQYYLRVALYVSNLAVSGVSSVTVVDLFFSQLFGPQLELLNQPRQPD